MSIGPTAATDWAFATLGWTDVTHAIEPAPFEVPVDVWGRSRTEWMDRRR